MDNKDKNLILKGGKTMSDLHNKIDELVQAILSQEEDGLDRREFIASLASEIQTEFNLGKEQEHGKIKEEKNKKESS